jgi:hypothetical protein
VALTPTAQDIKNKTKQVRHQTKKQKKELHMVKAAYEMRENIRE